MTRSSDTERRLETVAELFRALPSVVRLGEGAHRVGLISYDRIAVPSLDEAQPIDIGYGPAGSGPLVPAMSVAQVLKDALVTGHA